jgi:rare lipoprotein A (peptidoglycan hydrolase)
MRRTLAQGLAIAFLIAGTGAAQGPNNSEATPAPISSTRIKPETKKPAGQPYQVGTASWYGSDFDGRLTASGEPYDMYDMTAAHLKLPLGSYVRVTNLHNGRAVVVKINDRGPIVPGRIIDLSYGAALALGYNSRGLQRVRLDVVKPRRQSPTYETVADNRPTTAIPAP